MSEGKGQTRAHLYVSGDVQGVGFRWNARQRAQELGLTGWVRNLHDGRVEAVFEGPEEKVREAVNWCHKGSRPARVDDIDVSYKEATREFKEFRIAH